MFKKFGIVNNRELKNGPIVKESISETSPNLFEKIVICSKCGAKLKKTCNDKYVCNTSILQCPKCGSKIS